MKEKVAQFYKGEFVYDTPKVLVSEKEINLLVGAGSIYHGSFTIKNNQDTNIKGILYSSSSLVKLSTNQFSGITVKIAYELDATYKNPGEIYEESIKIISDCGEFKLPIRIRIEDPFFDSSLGKIRDLSQFAQLAKDNWEEALSIYRTKEFHSYLLNYNNRYLLLYEELIKSKSIHQGMEEFLISINKKLPIHLNVEQDNYYYQVDSERIADKIVITKDNWGYIEAKVSTDAPFISINKEGINQEAFIGNRYFLEFVINPENMHKGNNYGRIFLTTIYETLEIKVAASITSKNHGKRQSRRKLKACQFDVGKHYIDFRLNKINKEEYISKTNTLLQSKLGEFDFYLLLRIHLCIMNNEEEKGRILLEQLESKAKKWKRDHYVLYCGYLYLNALYSSDTVITKTIKLIEKQYAGEYQNKWQLLWILIYLDPRYHDKKRVLQEIKEQFAKGCKSPVLYYEALKIYNENPSHLQEFDNFELQVLNWGRKNNNISKTLSQQFIYLGGKSKFYHKLIFDILNYIYEKYKTKEALTAICSLLIKGHKRNQKYFYWYRLGIESNLRITELYEYYMYSLNEKEYSFKDSANKDFLEHKDCSHSVAGLVLPHSVPLYFLYSKSLDIQKRSYLYAYVINNKEKDPKTYRAYLKNMEQFAKEQITAGNVNPYLSDIYKEIFIHNHLLADKKPKLLNVLFRYEIVCSNPNIKGVIVAHKEFNNVSYTPFTGGTAQVNIYSKSAKIFLIDGKENRYYNTIDYDLNQLMQWEKTLMNELILREEFPIPFIEKILEHQRYDSKSMNLRKKALQLPDIKESFYNTNLYSLIYFYYHKSDWTVLDSYLEKLENVILKSRKDYKIIEIMIERKFFSKTLEPIIKYGFHYMSTSHLSTLCTWLLEDEELKDEKVNTLLSMCYHCFAKKESNSSIIEYLSERFQGTCNEMFEMWKEGCRYGVDTTTLEERLLAQILFTESEFSKKEDFSIYEIYEKYMERNSNSNLIKAFINYQAYNYLIRNSKIESGFFNQMENLIRTAKNDLCTLAILKFYSSHTNLDEEKIKFITHFVKRYVNHGIILPYFKEFKKIIPIPYNFIHNTFIEYKTDPINKVMIHYRFLDNKKDGEYISEEMKDIFKGIHIKEFQLFYKEAVQYYITDEEPNGYTTSTKESIIELGQDMDLNEENIYNHINYMKVSLDMKDVETFIDSYSSFIKSEYIFSRLFTPLGLEEKE